MKKYLDAHPEKREIIRNWMVEDGAMERYDRIFEIFVKTIEKASKRIYTDLIYWYFIEYETNNMHILERGSDLLGVLYHPYAK